MTRRDLRQLQEHENELREQELLDAEHYQHTHPEELKGRIAKTAMGIEEGDAEGELEVCTCLRPLGEMYT